MISIAIPTCCQATQSTRAPGEHSSDIPKMCSVVRNVFDTFPLKVLRPYFLSPCRKRHKKGSSPRNHSNAEVLRPRVYSNVVGLHGRVFIAISWVLRPRVYSNVHSRFTHDFSRFLSRYVYLSGSLRTF